MFFDITGLLQLTAGRRRAAQRFQLIPEYPALQWQPLPGDPKVKQGLPT